MLKPAAAIRLWPVLVVASALVFVACARIEARNPSTPTQMPEPTQTPVPTPELTQTPTVEPTPTETPGPTSTPTPTAEPSPTAVSTPAGTATSIPINNVRIDGLTLEVEGTSHEIIVYGDRIVLRGQTTADAIVSINGVIVPVDATGRFEVPLMLLPGPNEIQVVASDLDGNKLSSVFHVVSLPEGEA